MDGGRAGDLLSESASGWRKGAGDGCAGAVRGVESWEGEEAWGEEALETRMQRGRPMRRGCMAQRPKQDLEVSMRQETMSNGMMVMARLDTLGTLRTLAIWI